MSKKVKIVLIVAAVIILAEVVLTGTLLVVKHNAENSYAQHLELAQKYLEDGDYEEAIAEFEAAIEIQPKQTDAYTGLADAYIAMGDYEAAVDILNEGYEATGERTVRSKLKSTQELMASAAEATVETAEAESTENAEQTVGNEAVEAVSAETSADDYYYAVATSMTKVAVEEYASNVRNLFIQHKWSNLAGLIEFPITIDGITYDSIASFVQGGLDDIYSDDFMNALEAEDCVDMYRTSAGIVLGNNNVVIAEVEKNGASALKIVGVNGLVDEEKRNVEIEGTLDENIVEVEAKKSYQEIVDEFAFAISNRDTLSYDEMAEMCPNAVNTAIMYTYYYDAIECSFYYAYYDINSDGTEELIIGCDACDDWKIAIYTFNGTNSQDCFSEDSLGYRQYLDIYENGEMVISGSGKESFYSIAADGYTINTDAYIEAEYANGDGLVTIYDGENTEVLAESVTYWDYDSSELYAKYCGSCNIKTDFNWKIIQ